MGKRVEEGAGSVGEALAAQTQGPRSGSLAFTGKLRAVTGFLNLPALVSVPSPQDHWSPAQEDKGSSVNKQGFGRPMSTTEMSTLQEQLRGDRSIYFIRGESRIR